MRNRHLFKILGLSMIVAVSVMAVNAAGAQAKWLILKNKVSEATVSATGKVNAGRLKVEGLGLTIECTGGTAAATLETIESGKNIEGKGSATFTVCDVAGAEEVCDVQTPGKSIGTIFATGEGLGSMSGAKTFATLTSTNFTTIAISGEECPFNEIEEKVNGSVTLTVLNPTENLESHGIELDEVSGQLKFGEETATLEGSGGGPVTGSATVGAGDKWELILRELP